MKYPTDIALNEHKDIEINDQNDIGTVSGVNQIQQSVAIDALDELRDFIGGRITGENIGSLERRLFEAFEDDPQVATIQNITVSTYNTDTETVTIDVTLIEDDDFTIELST